MHIFTQISCIHSKTSKSKINNTQLCNNYKIFNVFLVPAVSTVYYTLYTVRRTVYSVHYTVYTVQCTLYNIKCVIISTLHGTSVLCCTRKFKS